MHEELRKLCPNCPKRTNRRGELVGTHLDLVRDNYSGCGVDHYQCPECNELFQVSYKIDQITPLEDYQKKPPFGEYFQAVLQDLLMTHNWDDPYKSISPEFHDGRWIDMIYDGYETGADVKMTAAVIHANRGEHA